MSFQLDDGDDGLLEELMAELHTLQTNIAFSHRRAKASEATDRALRVIVGPSPGRLARHHILLDWAMTRSQDSWHFGYFSGPANPSAYTLMHF